MITEGSLSCHTRWDTGYCFILLPSYPKNSPEWLPRTKRSVYWKPSRTRVPTGEKGGLIDWLFDVRHCSSMFVNVRHRSSMFGNVRHRSSMFVNVRHCSSMFVNTPYNGEKYFNDCIMFCKVIDMEWEIHFQIWIPKHYLQAIKLLFQLQKSGIVMHLELDYRTCLWVEVGLWIVPPPLPQMNASKWLILAFDTLYIYLSNHSDLCNMMSSINDKKCLDWSIIDFLLTSTFKIQTWRSTRCSSFKDVNMTHRYTRFIESVVFDYVGYIDINVYIFFFKIALC